MRGSRRGWRSRRRTARWQVVDTFLEACEQISLENDSDVRVNADEFTRVLLADDIMALGALRVNQQ